MQLVVKLEGAHRGTRLYVVERSLYQDMRVEKMMNGTNFNMVEFLKGELNIELDEKPIERFGQIKEMNI